MKRIYHHYEKWEETIAGLWAKVSNHDKEYLIKRALNIMQDAETWGVFMMRVVRRWVYSCEHNLSHTSHNRVAWLGQAAICLAIGACHEITKAVWWLLSEGERDAANKEAELVIAYWEKQYA